MVFVNVTYRSETRKFQVPRSGITFEELKTQIASLIDFSSYLYDFKLRYHDVNNDVVSFSTDAEVATALSQHPSNEVWKLEVVPVVVWKYVLLLSLGFTVLVLSVLKKD